MTRLTKAQSDALLAIAAGEVTMRNRGHSAFRIDGATPQVVGKLVSLKLARWPKGACSEQTCVLTDAGSAAVEALNSLPLESFARADLIPHAFLFRCPACGKSTEVDDLEEDIAGEFRVPDSERYRTCECGASVDIGWAGWRWHPAKPAGGTP